MDVASIPGLPLTGTDRLNSTHAPDIIIMECRLSPNNLPYFKPKEPDTLKMGVKSGCPLQTRAHANGTVEVADQPRYFVRFHMVM